MTDMLGFTIPGSNLEKQTSLKMKLTQYDIRTEPGISLEKFYSFVNWGNLLIWTMLLP